MIASTFRENLFSKHVVLVTGAGRGIGRGIAEAFGRLGATLVFHDRNNSDLTAVRESAEREGWKSAVVVGDLSRTGVADEAFSAALACHGRIDVLINNAGRSWGIDTGDIDDAIAHELIELNFTSVLSLSRAFVRHSRQRGGGGSIVQIASTAGVVGFERRAVYSGTKFGTIGLTKVLALDHARENIRVNAVLPHVVETEMFRTIAKPGEIAHWRSGIPMGRFAKIEDVAAMVVFLCSPAASYLTGGVYPVDGGFMAGPFGGDQ